MMKWAFRTGIGWVGVALALSLQGCTSLTGAKYHLPDYYNTSQVHQRYYVGYEYNIDYLRCRERPNKCMARTPENWQTHRSYSQPYYFE